MNKLLTAEIIRRECVQVISGLSSDDDRRAIYDGLGVDISRKDYDFSLKIEYDAREVECVLPPEALKLSLDYFSKMYLVPACAVVAPRLPNI